MPAAELEAAPVRLVRLGVVAEIVERLGEVEGGADVVGIARRLGAENLEIPKPGLPLPCGVTGLEVVVDERLRDGDRGGWGAFAGEVLMGRSDVAPARLGAGEALEVEARRRAPLHLDPVGAVLDARQVAVLLARAAKQQLGPVAIEERGALFEGLVATLLRGWNDYRGLYDSISYWAPTEGRLEVDFLLQRGKRFIAIEVKSGRALRAVDLAGLRAIESLAGLGRRLIVYPEIEPMKTQEGIEVVSFAKLAELLETESL